MADRLFIGTGRRKSSVAQVRMVPGTGKLLLMVVTFMNSFHMKLM